MDRDAYHHGNLREALLQEAAVMIADRGTSSVTLREIGRRLGVSRSALYRHFSDKNDLLEAVAHSGFEELNHRLAAISKRPVSSGVSQLRAMGTAYVRFAVENPARYRLMYGREAMGRDAHPKLQEAASALFELFETTIRSHQTLGSIRRGNAETQAYVAWSAVHGLASLLIERQITEPADAEHLIRQLIRTILDGLRPR